MTPIEGEVKAFADAMWPNRSVAGRLRKLGEEFGELAEALAEYNGGNRSIDELMSEAADCAIILADFAAMHGRSLTNEMARKLEVNWSRVGERLRARNESTKGGDDGTER